VMSSASGRISRRQVLALLMTATAAGLAAACSAPAPAAPAAPTAVAPTTATAAPVSAAAAGTSQPKPGGTLRVSAVGDVANIDAQSWGPRNGFSIFMAYDTLTTYDLDLKPQPQLAESWEQTPDNTQLTVNLR